MWRQASQSRWLGSSRLPRICVIILLVAGLLVLVDLIPRMIIVASEARETAYWEAWEEAYIDNEAGAALHLPDPQILYSLPPEQDRVSSVGQRALLTIKPTSLTDWVLLCCPHVHSAPSPFIQPPSLRQSCLHVADEHRHMMAGGLGMWAREKASMTGRRWRRALWGRKSIKAFLHSEASPVPTTWQVKSHSNNFCQKPKQLQCASLFTAAKVAPLLLSLLKTSQLDVRRLLAFAREHVPAFDT